MTSLFSSYIYDTIDYTDIQGYLESRLNESKRPDSRGFLDYRKPLYTISDIKLQNSTCDILISNATLVGGSNRLGVRIFASANYSPKPPVTTTVEFNKIDEDEIADMSGHNLNYGFWIGGVIDNIIKTQIGDQFEYDYTFNDKIITLYWSFRIIICYDTYDGNGLDWCILATNIALKHAKIPSISLNNEGKFTISNPDIYTELKLTPIFSTSFCRIGNHLIVDPSLVEESHGNTFSLLTSPHSNVYQQLHYNIDYKVYKELEIANSITKLLYLEINF